MHSSVLLKLRTSFFGVFSVCLNYYTIVILHDCIMLFDLRYSQGKTCYIGVHNICVNYHPIRI